MGEAKRRELAELDAVEQVMNTLEGKNNAKLPKDLTAEQYARSLYVLAMGKPCYLCDGPESVVKVYTFGVPEQLQASTGPHVLYGLCALCDGHWRMRKIAEQQVLKDLEEMARKQVQ
jgi:hypothetical protein